MPDPRGRFRLPARLLTGIALGVAAAVWALSLTPPLRQIESWTVDMRLALLAPGSPARQEIVLVAVDEELLTRMPYRSPLDRGLLAAVTLAVVEAGARAVGLDFLFDQPTEARKDERLREVLLNAPMPVVVAFGGRQHGLTARQAAWLATFTDGLQRGMAVFQPDAIDGRVREIDAGGGGRPPSFAGALYTAVTGREVPAEPFFLAPVPTAGDPVFRTIPARLLLDDPDGPAAWLENRIVLIGAILPGDDRHDVARATTRGDLAGIEVHAHALARLIDGFQPRPAPGWLLPLILLLVSGLCVVMVGLRMATRLRLLVGCGLVMAALALVLVLAANEIMVPIAGPAEAALIGIATTRLRIAGVDRARRRFLHRAFGKYLSPALVQRLLEHPEELNIGGARREVTALFTDLEGFTAMTEDLEPEPLVELLNGYLDGICRCVVDHGGTVDKLVGDAVVALFNAPVDQPDHAAAAVRAGLAIDAFAGAFAARQSERLGRTFGRTRVGIATGTVTVGNFGGEVLFDYTAQGPAMNLAARLEVANKELGTTVCVADSTARACPEYSFRSLGTVRAKGFAAPVAVFTPVLAREEADDAQGQRGAA